MPVYIDLPTEYSTEMLPSQARRHGQSWCHLWADPESVDELHRIAAKCGVPRRHFQDRRGFPHYDLVVHLKERAEVHGARPHSLRVWTRKCMTSDSAFAKMAHDSKQDTAPRCPSTER